MAFSGQGAAAGASAGASFGPWGAAAGGLIGGLSGGGGGDLPDVSSATSGNVYLNSSGWVVGKGNATGGGSPWQMLLFAALAIYTVIEFKKIRG